MKFQCNRALSLLLVSCALLFVVASCKKSSNGGGAGLSATINGNVWAANFPVSGIYSSGQFEIGGIQIKGGDTTLFAVAFFSPITVNQAISSDTSEIDVNYADSKTQAIYDGGIDAGHSVITVTSYDSTNHKIAGIFTGVLYNTGNGNDSMVVAGGKFSTSFIAQ